MDVWEVFNDLTNVAIEGMQPASVAPLLTDEDNKENVDPANPTPTTFEWVPIFEDDDDESMPSVGELDAYLNEGFSGEETEECEESSEECEVVEEETSEEETVNAVSDLW